MLWIGIPHIAVRYDNKNAIVSNVHVGYSYFKCCRNREMQILMVLFVMQVVCLQEVQSNHYSDYINPELRKQGKNMHLYFALSLHCHSSSYEYLLVDRLNNLSFKPVLQNWCQKWHGIYVCEVMHIKDS